MTRRNASKIISVPKNTAKAAKRSRSRKEANKESEANFRLVADTAPALIWISGIDRRCTYVNKPWLDFTGRSLEQELGNGWAEGVHRDDLQRCLNTFTQSYAREEKFRIEYRLRRHDGDYRWILDIGVPQFDQDRSFAGYIGIAVDVTERKTRRGGPPPVESHVRRADGVTTIARRTAVQFSSRACQRESQCSIATCAISR